eukprot:XP_008678764.1 uncharacterized protein LOC103653714 [Zea mays]
MAAAGEQAASKQAAAGEQAAADDQATDQRARAGIVRAARHELAGAERATPGEFAAGRASSELVATGLLATAGQHAAPGIGLSDASALDEEEPVGIDWSYNDTHWKRKIRKNTTKGWTPKDLLPGSPVPTREQIMQESPGIVTRGRLALLMEEGASQDISPPTVQPSTLTKKMTPKRAKRSLDI